MLEVDVSSILKIRLSAMYRRVDWCIAHVYRGGEW